MKIAITGSSGRVGRALYFLLCQQHQIVSIDRSPSSSTTHVGNISDLDLLATTFQDADAVIHCAALHAPNVGINSDTEFQKVNVDGTYNVARMAKEAGVKQLVFTSTTALYGDASIRGDSAQWLTEETEPEPRTIYHRSKLQAEQILQSEANDNFKISCIRMSRCFPEPAPTMAVYRLHRGVGLQDVAEAHRLAIMSADTHFEKYIISGPTPFKKEDLAQLKYQPEEILKLRCPELCRVFAQRGWPLPKSIDRVYDSSKAQAKLGWQVKEGFQSVIDMLDTSNFETLPPQAGDSSIR